MQCKLYFLIKKDSFLFGNSVYFLLIFADCFLFLADIFGEDLSDSEEESSTIIRESADESDSMSSSLPSMQVIT